MNSYQCCSITCNVECCKMRSGKALSGRWALNWHLSQGRPHVRKHKLIEYTIDLNISSSYAKIMESVCESNVRQAVNLPGVVKAKYWNTSWTDLTDFNLYSVLCATEHYLKSFEYWQWIDYAFVFIYSTERWIGIMIWKIGHSISSEIRHGRWRRLNRN